MKKEFKKQKPQSIEDLLGKYVDVSSTSGRCAGLLAEVRKDDVHIIDFEFFERMPSSLGHSFKEWIEKARKYDLVCVYNINDVYMVCVTDFSRTTPYTKYYSLYNVSKGQLKHSHSGERDGYRTEEYLNRLSNNFGRGVPEEHKAEFKEILEKKRWKLSDKVE